MSEPLSGTITANDATVGPFRVSGKNEADVAIAITAGTARLERSMGATGFISIGSYTESQSLVIEQGEYQVVGTGTPNIAVDFVPRG